MEGWRVEKGKEKGENGEEEKKGERGRKGDREEVKREGAGKM